MLIISIIASVAFFVLLLFIAINLGTKSNKKDEPALSPTIHASGIYSIVRRSPRDTIAQYKPSLEQITQYLAEKNEDIKGTKLTSADKEALIEDWEKRLESNIREIESGDLQDIAFYYYEFDGDDPVCKGIVNKGHFVTREEIFKFPLTIPPFHLGCTCTIKGHFNDSNLRETTRLGFRPLFSNEKLPLLPTWSDIYKGQN